MTHLKCARDYFDIVITHNRSAYLASPANIAPAFNYAISLFHMLDWLYEEDNGILESISECEFKNLDAFKKVMLEKCVALQYMQGLANAAKHMKLKKSRTFIKDAKIIVSNSGTYGEGSYGQNKYGRGSVTAACEYDKIDFESEAEAAYSFFAEILSKRV